MKQLYVILCVLLLAGKLSARVVSDSVTVFFPVSRTELRASYMDNEERLTQFVSQIDSILRMKPEPTVRSIDIFGAASPEGSYDFNRTLSEGRAKSIMDYLDGRLALPDSAVTISYAVRNWDALRRAVLADSLVPDREDVIRLLDSSIVEYPSPMSVAQSDRLLQSLRNLDGGRPYRFMIRNIFPALREATLVVTFSQRMPKPLLARRVMPRLTDAIADTLPEHIVLALPEPPAGKDIIWALRTNLLFDALAAPAIGAELYLGRNFSVQAQWIYAWWSHRSRNFYWRIYGGDIGVRWWFGKKARQRPLSGHHIGIYGQAMIWDFELGGRGYMGGAPPGAAIWNRANLGVGVEYGYSLPLAERWNLDFCIGIGYVGGAYREYIPMCGSYVWQSTKNLNYIGPSKAEISLVYRF